MGTLDQLEDRVNFLEGLIADHLTNTTYRKNSVGKKAWLKKLKGLCQQLEAAKGRIDTWGTQVQVLEIKGKYKTFDKIKGVEIGRSVEFRILFAGITEEDVLKLLKKKLNSFDPKTIEIRTLKLGEILT